MAADSECFSSGGVGGETDGKGKVGWSQLDLGLLSNLKTMTSASELRSSSRDPNALSALQIIGPTHLASAQPRLCDDPNIISQMLTYKFAEGHQCCSRLVFHWWDSGSCTACSSCKEHTHVETPPTYKTKAMPLFSTSSPLN